MGRYVALCANALVLVCCVVNSVSAENRFHVFTYADSPDINNPDSFYVWLDDWGVSEFMTHNPDVAAAQRVTHELHYKLIAVHSQRNDMHLPIGILDSADHNLFGSWYLDQYYGALAGLTLPINAANTEVVQGYRTYADSTDFVGALHFDLDLGRYVRAATAGVHDPGLIHTRFDRGCFQWLDGHPYYVDTLECYMRCPNLDLDTANGICDTTVVAQVVLYDWGAWDEGRNDYCREYPTPYAGELYNDSLLIVGDGVGGIDTVVALDYVPSKCRAVNQHCEVLTGSDSVVANPGMNHVCYCVGADTICVMPYRYTKDIRIKDFADDVNYHTFTMPLVGAWTHAYEVYWTGKKTIYLDGFWLHNGIGRRWEELLATSVSRDSVMDFMRGWYDSHIQSGSIDGIYLRDEPRGYGMYQNRRLREVISSLGSPYPTEVYSTVIGYLQSAVADDLMSEFYDIYADALGNDYFAVDDYRNECDISHSSDQYYYYTDLQVQIDNYIRTLSKAAWRAGTMQPTRHFWAILAAYAGYGGDPAKDTVFCKARRYWTEEELRVQVHLALAFGAHGIGYWQYGGGDCCSGVGEASGEEQMGPSNDELYEMMTGEGDRKTRLYEASLCANEQCSCLVYKPYGLAGIVNFDENRNAVRPPQWYETRSINKYLDTMSYFFNNATWQSAGPYDTAFSELAGAALVDSIKSFAGYENPFLYVGFFELDTSSYVYMVNRRAMNEPGTTVDSQTVRIFFSDGPGAYEIWQTRDIDTSYTVFAETIIDTVFDSTGTLFCDVYLPAGGAALLKREKIHGPNWQGTIDRNWTWTPGATINVVGDLLVDSGITLTVRSGNIGILPYTDSTVGGVDANKTELRVSGLLRLEGEPDYRIAIGPDTTLDSCWWGVKTLGLGRVVINNAIIRNAYCALWLEGNVADTVIGSRFQDYFINGLNLKSDSAFIYQDTFASTPARPSYYPIYAAWAYSPCLISTCFFDNCKLPVRLYSSNLTVSNCEFREFDYHYLGSGGYAAISAGYNSDATIEGCTFNNRVNGVLIEVNSDVVINDCEFKSDSTRDNRPFMYTAVKGTPNPSSCIIRNSCFKPCEKYHIQTDSTVFDLGSVPDSGFNSFHVQRVYYDVDSCLYTCKPYRAVYNNSGETIEAEVNYWDADACSPWVDGSIDMTPLGSGWISCYFATAQCGVGVAPKTSDIDEQNLHELPLVFEVRQNYPNPFNPVTTISFSLPNAEHVKLEVFNVLGQQVNLLLDEYLAAGDHVIQWDGRNASGESVSTGIYLYRLAAGTNVQTRKMLMMK